VKQELLTLPQHMSSLPAWIDVEINLTLVSHWFSNILILSIPDDGYYVPDEGYYIPDEGYYVPDEGYYVPDEGYYVPDEGYSRNVSCALDVISTFLLLFKSAFPVCKYMYKTISNSQKK
jgi:hypothetical protein